MKKILQKFFMNGLPEEILRCFRADFTEHLTYEELQHLHLLKKHSKKRKGA